MSKYVENNLRNGETIVMKAKKNPFAWIDKHLVWGLIFIALGIALKICCGKFFANEESISDVLGKYSTYIMIGFIVIGCLIILYRILYMLSLTLAITNKRVVGRVGILKKEILDYPIEKVENVYLKSSFFGAIFSYYSVSVQGANNSVEIKFHGISNANALKNALTDAVEKHQDEARKAQAEEIALAMQAGKKDN